MPKITVHAKPKAKRAGITKVTDTHFIVAVAEPADKGKANVAIARALAGHFGVGVSRVRLVSGFSSRKKLFEIMTG